MNCDPPNETAPAWIDGCSPLEVRAVLGLALVFLAANLMFLPSEPLENNNKPSDLDLYWAEVQRIRDGQTYYAAAAEELTTRGYPTSSPFNWRTPLPMWLIAQFPSSSVAKGILISLSVAFVLLAAGLTLKYFSFAQGVVATLWLAGAILPTMLDFIYISPVLWAGILVALGVMLIAYERSVLGPLVLLIAGTFRELAIGALGVLSLLAWLRRDQRLLNASLVCGLCFVFFYAWHIAQVNSTSVRPTRGMELQQWFRAGGPKFLVQCASMHGFLILLPKAVSAIYLPLAVLGAWGWPRRVGLCLLSVLVPYLVLFALFGRDNNIYWGKLITPTLALSVVGLPTVIGKLIRPAIQKKCLTT